MLPYQPHSPTSAAAAEEAEGLAVRAIERVLAFINARGRFGATDEEMQRILRMNPNTQRPRRVELQRQGVVVDSGEMRDTRSGRQAVVWIAAALLHPANPKEIQL